MHSKIREIVFGRSPAKHCLTFPIIVLCRVIHTARRHFTTTAPAVPAPAFKNYWESTWVQPEQEVSCRKYRNTQQKIFTDKSWICRHFCNNSSLLFSKTLPVADLFQLLRCDMLSCTWCSAVLSFASFHCVMLSNWRLGYGRRVMLSRNYWTWSKTLLVD